MMGWPHIVPGHDRPGVPKHFACQIPLAGLPPPVALSTSFRVRQSSAGRGLGQRKMTVVLPDFRSFCRQRELLLVAEINPASVTAGRVARPRLILKIWRSLKP